MNISISRDGIEIGEWTEEEVREFYREGRLVDADCYWLEGMTEWIPLSRLMRPPPPFPAPSNPASSPENPVERLSVVAPIVEPSVSSLPLTPLEGQLKAGFKSRIAARSIDMALVFVPALILAIPVFILFGFAQPEDIGTAAWGLSLLGQAIAYDVAFLLWEVVWIGTIGTTPGKAIFGIKVVRRNGEQMQMNIAWKRVWRLFRSLGFLIVFPLTGLPIALRNQKKFLETGTTFWDEVAGTEVTGKKIGGLRKSIGTVLFIFSVLFWLSLFPSHLSSGSRSQTQTPVVAAPSTDSTPQTPAEPPAQLAPSPPEPVTPSAPAIVAPPPAPEPAAPPAVVKVASDNEEAAGYRIKATAGDVVAASELGRLYYLGMGVPRDYVEALKWLRVAADHGDAYGQDKIGEMYRDGHALTKDYSQAITWFQKSADQGFADAQSNMGDMYKTGRGVAKDEVQAQKWFETALPGLKKDADQGDVEAQDDLGDMYSQGDGVIHDDSQAFGWYQKAADQGYAGAQADIGAMYDEGKGVAQDYGQALIWYQKAAAQGNMFAQFRVGLMYASGQGVAQDYSQALIWYRKAAAQGNMYAQFAIGCMYASGKGVPRDYGQAFAWNQKAANQGNANAQYANGYMYENGYGVAQDPALAVEWYRKAAAQGQSDAQAALRRLGQ